MADEEEAFDVEEFAEGVKNAIIASGVSGGCCTTSTSSTHELEV